jgi:hypothetical protein
VTSKPTVMIPSNFIYILSKKLERKRHVGRQRRRWEDGLRMDVRKIGWGGVEWIQLAQDRDWWQSFVNAVTNLRFLAPQS